MSPSPEDVAGFLHIMQTQYMKVMSQGGNTYNMTSIIEPCSGDEMLVIIARGDKAREILDGLGLKPIYPQKPADPHTN